jgi:hypothetical protein
VRSGGHPLQAQPHERGVRPALPHLPRRGRVRRARAALLGRVWVLPHQRRVRAPMPRASLLLLLHDDGCGFAPSHPLPRRGGCDCPTRCSGEPPPLHDSELHIPLRGPLQAVVLRPLPRRHCLTLGPDAAAGVTRGALEHRTAGGGIALVCGGALGGEAARPEGGGGSGEEQRGITGGGGVVAAQPC